ncbi:AmmeMemoRadiSam system protein B [Candidatus Woesearchaeota archaeon]|nr:AmmeMemoRadiSam system protein B [Candidatus Woesearchaeota archaeon]
MTRKPIVAGSFYPEDFNELDKAINNSFTQELGPGELPGKRTNKKLKAIIVPHAGITYSGMCAAWAYKELGESVFAKTYILLGPNHSGIDGGVLLDDFMTPFGIVKTDKSLAQKLIANGLQESKKSHDSEHSIEVQLPFLQFVSRDNLSNLQIIAITISEDYSKAAQVIKKTLEQTGKADDVIFIVSSDFTHYGQSYNYIPFVYNIDEELDRLDGKAFELIKKFDITGFDDFLKDTKATICGAYAIKTLMQLVDGKVELLCYYRSSKLTKDQKNSVSYASFTIS